MFTPLTRELDNTVLVTLKFRECRILVKRRICVKIGEFLLTHFFWKTDNRSYGKLFF